MKRHSLIYNCRCGEIQTVFVSKITNPFFFFILKGRAVIETTAGGCTLKDVSKIFGSLEIKKVICFFSCV